MRTSEGGDKLLQEPRPWIRDVHPNERNNQSTLTDTLGKQSTFLAFITSKQLPQKQLYSAIRRHVLTVCLLIQFQRQRKWTEIEDKKIQVQVSAPE